MSDPTTPAGDDPPTEPVGDVAARAGSDADTVTASEDAPVRAWWRRPVVLAGAGALVLLLVFAGVVFALDRSIERVEVDGLAGSNGEVTVPDTSTTTDADDLDAAEVDVVREGADEGLTVLVLGSDSREVLTTAEQQELGTGNVPGERTEVVALVRLDPEADEMRILNVPRDAVVTRCDGSRGRINGAYGIGERDGRGGTSCVVQTLTTWSGVEIDHAMKVDFRGFVDIVDALGGVEFHLEQPLRDTNANLDLDAGCVRLDGGEALAFARARGIDNDYGRIARQQRLVAEIRAELAEAGIFSDAVRLVRTAEAVARNVELDDSLTLNRIGQLALTYRTTITADLRTQAIPGGRMPGTEAWLLQVDEEAATEAFTWLVDGPETPVEALPDTEDDADGTGGPDAGSGADTDDATGTDDGAPTGEPSTEHDATQDDADDDGSGLTGDTAISSPGNGDAPVGSTPQRCG
ncbi:MAG: LCP family protein [Nitriliruptoraceae bacterium]|nr:LCP family protein [Nitriliruptoraceae bacterium]